MRATSALLKTYLELTSDGDDVSRLRIKCFFCPYQQCLELFHGSSGIHSHLVLDGFGSHAESQGAKSFIAAVLVNERIRELVR